MPNLATNVHYGDNLDILGRYLPDAAVDPATDWVAMEGTT